MVYSMEIKIDENWEYHHLRVGLVEARACFGGCMIKSAVFYRVFVLLEFRRAKQTNFLKAQIMCISVCISIYIYTHIL